MSILKKTSFITTISILLITLAFLILHVLSSRQELMKNLDDDFRYKKELIHHELSDIANDLELATKHYILNNRKTITLFVDQKRDELYRQTQELYADLNKKYHEKLAVMHFYKPGTLSFLRMHNPEKFGDITADHRPFLKEIDDKKLKKPLTGFEAGRFSISYRVEVPLFIDQNYIGIMDYGVDISLMSHFLESASKLESAVILASKKAEPILYKKSKKIAENYELYSATSPLFESIAELPEKNTIIFLSHKGKKYALYAMPLFGHGDEELALYVMAQDVTSVYTEWQKSLLLWLGASLLMIIMTITIFRKSLLPLIKELDEEKELLTEAQSIAKIGNWTFNIGDNTVVCSEEVFRIVEMEYEHPKSKQRLEDMMKFIHPEDKKTFEKDLLKVLEHRKDATLIHRIIRKKTGQTAYVSHICKVNKKENKVHCTVQDITELVLSKKAEMEALKSLKASEDKFHYITDAAQDGIIMLDDKGELSYWNPKAKEILGYEEEELKGEDFHSIVVPKQYYEAYKKGYEEFVKSGKGAVVGKTLELSAIRKGGVEFPVSLSIGGVKIGERWFGIGVIRDISKIKKIESELKAKDEMMLMQSRQAAMGEMIEMIAHQWRQPITVIAMAANNIQISMEMGDEIGKEQLDSLVDTITEQTQKLSKIISMFTKHLRHVETKKSISVIESIESTMKIMGEDLSYDNINVVIENNSKSKINIYEGELTQVFINLIVNAKDAVIANKKEDRKIDIKIYEKNEHIITAICDNGGGISQENMKRLAEPYFTTKGENEKGLGLYISKTIIQKHFGGDLKWGNKGDGACFVVKLPLHK